MASPTTLSSPPPPHLINVSHRFVSTTNSNSIFLRRRILRRFNRTSASYRKPFESENRFFGDYYDDEEEEEEDERESSVDLLIRFLRSMFKKISKRAKKASRQILPAAMSPRLVSFGVDGILILGSLSIAKAFLEVICNIGGTVFTVIMLIRLFWAGASFFQTYGNSFGPNPF
ncbi:unnamed protein product [Cochlearia groenlandica]